MTCEVCGFWLAAIGWLGFAAVLYLMTLNEAAAEAVMKAVERWTGVQWYMQLVGLPIVCYLLLFVGLHMHCLGNCGRWPGYPLNVLLSWWNGT